MESPLNFKDSVELGELDYLIVDAPVRVRAPLCSLDSAVSSLGRVLRLQPLTRFSLLFYLLAVHLTVLVHLMLSSRMLPPVPVPDEGDSATLKLD